MLADLLPGQLDVAICLLMIPVSSSSDCLHSNHRARQFQEVSQISFSLFLETAIKFSGRDLFVAFGSW